MKKGWNTAFLAFCGLALLLLPVWTAFAPREEKSLYENRPLAEEPVLTRETLFDGSWFAEEETWLQDHFAGRDALLRLDLRLRHLTGTPFVGGVLLSDGPLLPETQGPEVRDPAGEAAAAAADLAALQKKVESYGGVFLYVCAANQYSACRGNYPFWMRQVGEHLDRTHDAFFAALAEAGVRFLDLSAAADPSDYYRTDHHLTLPAAVSLCGKIFGALEDAGVSPAETGAGEYTYRTLPNPFYGSRSRRLYGLVPFDERVTVFDRGPDVPFTREDEGKASEPVLLDLPATETEIVDYGIFMGGDMGETVLRTNRPELPSALLFGDSYTNALETVFYTGFDETRSLDLRYSDTDLFDYIDTHRPDVVVCLRDDANLLNRTGNGRIIRP